MAEAATQPLQSPTYTLSGCDPVPMSSAEVADYEGRYEYWEAATGLAWVLRDASPKHEHPSSRLVALVNDIGKMRGTPITMYGNADLQEREADGARLRAAQADQMIYLDCPGRPPEMIVVGVFPLPDVVFEVDLTTDIRDRKLDVYAAWGVPELWVEVPDADLPSKRKRPGLTIHRLEGGRFREHGESAAFPTLTAREIHAALNEPSASAATVDTVRRVGAIMGRRTGTGPEDDPFLGVERRLSRREGRREGRRDERMSMLEGLLEARGMDITPRLGAEAHRIAALPQDTLLRAALESTDLDDFLARLGS